ASRIFWCLAHCSGVQGLEGLLSRSMMVYGSHSVSTKPICFIPARTASSKVAHVLGSVTDAGWPVRGFNGTLSGPAQTHCGRARSSIGMLFHILRSPVLGQPGTRTGAVHG